MKNISVLALLVAKAIAYEFNDGSYSISLQYDAATHEILFITTQPDNTWLGILLGSKSMVNTEAIVFFASGGTSTAKNYYSTGEKEPGIATPQSVTTTIDSQTGKVKMTTRRPLDPGHTRQFVIPLDTEVTMGVAWNDGSISISQ